MATAESELIKQISLEDGANKADELLKNLTGLIVNHQLPSGYAFPNENAMCEMLSIGRGTLREVYKVLELKGFITRSKSGTVVNDANALAREGTFDMSLLLSEEENLIEFLSIVEPEAARLAALKATPEELDQIYDAMMKLEAVNRTHNSGQINECNALFHQLIREASHNPILISSICSSRKQYDERIIHPLINSSPASIRFMDTCLMQHYTLYYALKTGDGDTARRIMHEHFVTDLDYIKSLPPCDQKAQ